jgi:hypothetical protein
MFLICDIVSCSIRRRRELREVARMTKHYNSGLDSRCRDNDGEIRQKNGNTLVGTLRETYGDGFANGYRSDAKLSTVLNRENAPSLSQYLKRPR